MSAQAPETTPPAPKLADRLITIAGLLLVLAGVIVARVLRDSDPDLGADLGDIFKGFGAVIAAVGGPLPIGDLLRKALGAGGAKVLTVLVLGGLLSAGSLLGGCAALERREVSCTTAPEVVLEDLPDGRCALRGYCDGHELWTALGPGPCGEVEER